MKKIIKIVVIAALLASCNKRKELSITFVFDKPLTTDTKYPFYFQEIVMPFKSNCEVDYLLKPINISRLDISNKVVEINAWHFKDIGDNTIEFSKVWLEQYFKDSLINSYLTQASAKQVSIDDWIAKNKDSIFIYSEDEESNEYMGRPIFNNAKDLNSKIQETACANISGKIIVLINPSITGIPPPPPKPIIADTMQVESDTSTTRINTKSTVDNSEKTKTEIKNLLMQISNPDLTDKQRTLKVEEAMSSFFDKDFYVIMHNDDARDLQRVWDRGKGVDYLKRLTEDNSITGFEILRIEKSTTDNKISHIEVVEKHNK